MCTGLLILLKGKWLIIETKQRLYFIHSVFFCPFRCFAHPVNLFIHLIWLPTPKISTLTFAQVILSITLTFLFAPAILSQQRLNPTCSWCPHDSACVLRFPTRLKNWLPLNSPPHLLVLLRPAHPLRADFQLNKYEMYWFFYSNMFTILYCYNTPIPLQHSSTITTLVHYYSKSTEGGLSTRRSLVDTSLENVGVMVEATGAELTSLAFAFALVWDANFWASLG